MLGPDGTPIVKICEDGYVITQAMVDAQIRVTESRPILTPEPVFIVGVNASSNMFV